MRNFFKNLDVDDLKEQLSEIKDQVQDLKFRKPWTNGSETSPVALMAIGAALALIGATLYRNRSQVARLCSSCGTDLKDRWEASGMKERAEKVMDKLKNGAQEAKDKAGERYQPT